MIELNRTLAVAMLIILLIPNLTVSTLGESESILSSLIKVADWLVENQNPNGTFNLEMSHMHSEYQDALILGCASIVLLDAYKITENIKYLEAANLTLTLLTKWQEIDGDWSGHSRYAAGGVYYPIVAFAKFQIYTKTDVFMDNMLRAAENLIRQAEEKSMRYFYVFEMGERCYALLLVWKATNISRYWRIATRWVRLLEDEYFDFEVGAWNTRIDGRGPQGMWDAVLPALPLLVFKYVTLEKLANQSFFWALENLKSFEAGAYTPASRSGEMSLSNDVYRDQVNAYPHFTAEFLILAAILGKEAEAKEAADWLISMQAPDGGFYFRKKLDGSIDRREFVWDSFWAFFGLYAYLEMKMPTELGNMISKMESEIQSAEMRAVNTSLSKEYLSLALDSLNSEKYFKALNYIQMANSTLQASIKTFEIIEEVESMISCVRRMGANTTKAEWELSLALEAYNKGNYEMAEEHALKAKYLADLGLSEIKSEADRILKETGALLNETASAGINITEAEIIYEEALKLYSEGNYSGAIELSKIAQETAIQITNMAKKRTKIVTGLIVSTAILSAVGALVWRWQQIKRREIEMKEFMEKYGDFLDKYVILVGKKKEKRKNG